MTKQDVKEELLEMIEEHLIYKEEMIEALEELLVKLKEE